MTQDPKKSPQRRQGKQPDDLPMKPPSSEELENDSVDADLPPWLREDSLREDTPPPPKVKRLAQSSQEPEGDLPPWLAGIEDQPKSYNIGGAELSEEYLSGGDELPETINSEQTFDAWMAEQEESKRVKDIEEEIPDLFSGFEDAPPAQPPKQTGQLPDWFLGLEALDTSDAPEWFVAEEQPPASTGDANAIPPWISDMVAEEPAEETPPSDEVGSFFNSIGGETPDEDDIPQIDWSDTPETNEAPVTPDDDFFAQLVGGSSARRDQPGQAADDEAGNSWLNEVEANDETVVPDDDFFAQLVGGGSGRSGGSPKDSGSTRLLSDTPDEDEGAGSSWFSGAETNEPPVAPDNNFVSRLINRGSGRRADSGKTRLLSDTPDDDFVDPNDFLKDAGQPQSRGRGRNPPE